MPVPRGSVSLKFILSFCWIIVLSGCAHQRAAVEQLHAAGCAALPDDASPWHIAALYDCDSASLFIPWQLWSGASWTGDKTAPCMHTAKTHFLVDGDDPTTIRGPIPWKHPKLGKTLQTWHRTKDDGRKTQIFTCHEKGIGRVYDSRKPRVYAPGRCKFPAGPGWQLHKKRSCRDTSLEVYKVELNASNELQGLHFRYWFGNTLDHAYRYAPGRSMTDAKRIPRTSN